MTNFNLGLQLAYFFEDRVIAIVDWLAIKYPLLRGYIMAIKTSINSDAALQVCVQILIVCRFLC